MSAGRLRRRRLMLGLVGCGFMVGGCGESPQPTELRTAALPSFTVTDGAHGGNPHFFWLPPMVSSPSTAGVFDPGVSPQIDICQWTGSACVLPMLATYTTTTGPGSETVRVDTTSSLYIVNWHTDQFPLVAGATYRIAASVLGAVVGTADVAVLSTGSAKNVSTGDDIPLLDGKTLPIKFRIELGMVVLVAVSPNPDTIIVNKFGGLTATLTDAHGAVVSDQPVAWSGDPSSIATVDAGGVVSGVAIGSATVTASSNGMSGSAQVQVIPPPVASVIVTPASSTILVGQKVQLSATTKDADGNVLTGHVVTWSADLSGNANVDQTGLVTGNATGSATITATSEGKSGTAGVTVNPAGFTVAIGSLAAGAGHSCGLSADGHAYCWGTNGVGQLGNGPIGPSSLVPTPVSGGLVFNHIVAGGRYTCGLTADGSASCWGANNVNQLGDGLTGDQEGEREVPAPVVGSHHFRQLVITSGAPCGLDASGTAWCWGWNDNGRVGASVPGPYPSPVIGLDGFSYSTLAEGGHDNCGITVDGRTVCEGVLGNYIVGTGHALTSLTVDEYAVCGLDASGAVWCSGQNQIGEFGNGSTSNDYVSVEVQGASGMHFVSLVNGVQSACGLTSSGDIYCWGLNDFGQLGNGSTTASTSPVQVVSSQTFTSIIGGDYHYCATGSDGGAYCWGYGGLGQLGDGTLNNRSTPVRVVNPTVLP